MPPLFFLLLLYLSSTSLSYPFNTSYHVDCGASSDSTDKYNTTWISDRFFTSGSTGLVSEPLRFAHYQEKTIRFFTISAGKKNCYVIPVTPGRYYVRTFTVYDNYDGKSHEPSFDLSVEGTLVFSWRSPWPEEIGRDGAYSDLLAYVADGEMDVCFYSIATDSPVIASLEVVQIDPASYDASSIGQLLEYDNFPMLDFFYTLRLFTGLTFLFSVPW